MRVEALVLLSTLSNTVLAADVPRPRGVGPEFAKFYKSSETFSCISNPSITIPLSQINDDYCDCPDGSDEPGTSACTFLSPLSPSQPLSVGSSIAAVAKNTTLALPGFYCKNKGHIPSYVPHTYVNDGVCDYEFCCDGSDEWGSVGGKKCEDKCKEIGKEWRRLDDLRQKSMRSALKKKEELVNEAKSLKAGVEMGIKTLEGEIQNLKIQEVEAKRKLEDTERRERGKVVGTRGGKGSKTTVLAELARRRVEELRGALLGVVGKRNQLREKVKELEAILSTFSEEYNPNFNDEGVKRAVKAWQDYAAQKGTTGEVDESAEDRDLESISQQDNENEGINWAEFETEGEESDVEAIYKIEEYLPIPLRSWIHEKLNDLRILLIENGILADTSSSSSNTESKAVSDARSAHQNIVNDISTKETNLVEQKADLEKDYGQNGIFRALKDKCITKDSGEYTYELCWYKSTSQKSKKGHGNTGMGNFEKFEMITVDEEVGADGKGLGKGERLALRYENGQTCWNGPARETTVILACAEQDEIWKITEMEKCKYQMEVGTPVVCEKHVSAAAAAKDASEGKDEL